MKRLGATKCGNTEFRWGERTYVMGIINLSPDSFSGDGIADLGAAAAQAHRFVSEGADILDIGGESTRPGSTPVSISEEIKRVVPIIERLSSEVPVPLSVDTYKAEVARRALEAGAAIINDQWGLKRDQRLAELAAERNIPLILMSNQRDKGGYDTEIDRDTASYDDPVIGPSRKSFIGLALNLPVEERVEGTAAAVAIGIAKGADIVRVHDVQQMVRVCRLSDAIIRSD